MEGRTGTFQLFCSLADKTMIKKENACLKDVGVSGALGRPHMHSSESYMHAQAAGVYMSMNYRGQWAYI